VLGCDRSVRVAGSDEMRAGGTLASRGARGGYATVDRRERGRIGDDPFVPSEPSSPC
jgi:hypothetical protein